MRVNPPGFQWGPALLRSPAPHRGTPFGPSALTPPQVDVAWLIHTVAVVRAAGQEAQDARAAARNEVRLEVNLGTVQPAAGDHTVATDRAGAQVELEIHGSREPVEGRCNLYSPSTWTVTPAVRLESWSYSRSPSSDPSPSVSTLPTQCAAVTGDLANANVTGRVRGVGMNSSYTGPRHTAGLRAGVEPGQGVMVYVRLHNRP